MTAIKTFEVGKKDLSTLTKNEQKMLPKLIEAVKQVDKVFLLQENLKYPGANFYPHHLTTQDIKEVANNNYSIFSPFSVVEEDESGKVATIEYHVKYANLIKPVAESILAAANICENKSFKNYLEKLAQALTQGKYQEADVAWLAVKDSNLDFVIGPYERNLDKLFFVKRAYQGYVGIIDRKRTAKAEKIRDIIYATVGSKPHRIIPPTTVELRAVRNLVFSGFLGRTLFSLQHLPSDSDTTERYGSRILGYLSSIELKFEKLVYPIFTAIFEETFRARYTKEILSIGNYYHVLLYGIAQQLHRYRTSRERLKELFPVFDEANSMVSGVQHAKHLVLKGVIDQKELEAIMIAHICWIFSEWIIFRGTNVREDYLKGDALTLNFLMREGALLEKEGISWPNFAKMFFEIENLSAIFTRFLEQGDYWEAQEFLSKYLSFEPFKAFDKYLPKIKSI